MTDQRPIIIKKIKKVSGGHHGGAWKVAYADFVTAMMAFFLLMWLLNATSEEQKRGISNYFAPIGVQQGTTGSGGVLGGLTVSSEGSFTDSKTSPAVAAMTPAQKQTERDDDTNQPATGLDENDGKNDAQEQKENAEFENLKQAIDKMVQNSPEIKDLAENLIVDITPEGLRIQIVDLDKKSMFPIGSAIMDDHTKELFVKVTEIIKSQPNKISISGHTDATPYAKDGDYGNWELSADRANACRKVLVENGISNERVKAVVGKAENDPLNKNDPFSAQNRRISIVLLNAKHSLPESHLSKS